MTVGQRRLKQTASDFSSAETVAKMTSHTIKNQCPIGAKWRNGI